MTCSVKTPATMPLIDDWAPRPTDPVWVNVYARTVGYPWPYRYNSTSARPLYRIKITPKVKP